MKEQRIQAILYDFDGIMVDSFVNCFEAYKLICDYLNHPRFSFEEFKEWYDPAWMHNLNRLAKGKTLKEENIKHIQSMYIEVMQNGSAEFHPGTLDLVHWAKSHCKQGIVSGGYKKDMVPRLQKEHLLSYFPVIIDHQDGYIKPHPKPMQMALNILQITPDRVAYIGDMAIDVAFARNANIGTVVLCTAGWESPKSIEKSLAKYQVQPDHIVNSHDALLFLMQSYNGYL
jgi:pyrophosphatase PpaX